MEGKPQDYMYLGIVHGMIFPRAMENSKIYYETLKKIATDSYFATVEIVSPPDTDFQRIRKILSRFSIAPTYAASPFTLEEKYDLGNPDDEVRKQAIKKVCEEIDKANSLGIKRVEITSGKEMKGTERAKGLEKLISSLREICEYAEKEEMKTEIILETFDSDIEKKRMLGSSQDAVEVADKVSQDFNNFGILLDLSHIPLLGEEIEDSVRTLAKHLKHIHLGNCIVKDMAHPAYGDQHPPFGVRGSEIGVEEVRRFLAACFKSGYLGEEKKSYVSFEVKPLPGQLSEDVIENAKDTLEKAWKAL